MRLCQNCLWQMLSNCLQGSHRQNKCLQWFKLCFTTSALTPKKKPQLHSWVRILKTLISARKTACPVTLELEATLKSSHICQSRFWWVYPPSLLPSRFDCEWSCLSNQSDSVLMLRWHMFGKLRLWVCSLSNRVVNAVCSGSRGI